VIGIIKFPVNIDAEGVLSVSPAYAKLTYVEEPGFVKEIGKNADGTTLKDGDFVHKGQVLLVLENEPLTTDLLVKKAQAEEVMAQMSAATAVSPVERQSKEYELAQLNKQIDLRQHEVDKLTIRAQIDGELIAPDLQYQVGRYFAPSKHELLRVVDPNKQYVEAALPQDDYQLLDQQHAWIQDHTEVRMVSDIPRVVKALSASLTPAQGKPISPALTPMGGGQSQIDPTDKEQAKLLTPEFRARVVMDDLGDYITGQRAYVRFKLQKKPLIWQWARRAMQLIESKGASAKWL